MRKILLISTLLAFIAAAKGANAITIENVTISDTGGVTVSGEASASGTSSADADVRSVIRTESSNTRIEIDVRAAADGEAEESSWEQTVGRGRLEVRVPISAQGSISGTVSATGSTSTTSGSTTTPSRFLSAWDGFKASFAKLYSLLFFFW